MWKIHFITIDNEITDVDKTLEFESLHDFIAAYGDIHANKRLPERKLNSLQDQYQSYSEAISIPDSSLSYVAVIYRYLYEDRQAREVVYERVQS